MPSCGVKDRNIIYTDLLHELAGILQIHSNKNWLIGGDLNTDLNNKDPISTVVNDFIVAHNLSRLDLAYPVSSRCTYVSESLCHKAKFHGDRLNRCWDLAIFRFFMMAAAPSWIFKCGKYRGGKGSRRSKRVTMPNFAEISQTVAGIWSFFDF